MMTHEERKDLEKTVQALQAVEQKLNRTTRLYIALTVLLIVCLGIQLFCV